MGLGKMNTFIDIVETRSSKDAEGFASKQDVVLASVRAYREGRHGSERWANLAVFSRATDLFRIRRIPNLTITTDHFILCDGEKYNITSVEDIRGCGMYVEILAERKVGSVG